MEDEIHKAKETQNVERMPESSNCGFLEDDHAGDIVMASNCGDMEDDTADEISP